MKQVLQLLLVLALLEGIARGENAETVIGNQYLELRFQKTGDRIAATTLHQRVSNRIITLSADDFSLSREGQAPLQSKDFKVHQVQRTGIPGGQRLSLLLRGGAGDVAVVYELMDDDFFLRRHLEFSPTAPMLLRQVEVWKIGLEGQCLDQETGPPEELLNNVWGVDRKTGFGKPVFLEDTFWGLEFPAGYNHYASGFVTLSHLPGRTITTKFISKTAVLGVAPPRAVASRFRAYIAQGRHRPALPAVQVDYNTWTTVSPATEANSLDLIGQFKRNLFEPHRVAFDSFTLDDGWDAKKSLWDLNTNGFPNGFKPLLAALQPMGTKLGLWLSPSSGYEHAAWGAKQGYARNATFDWFLCQSDPGYRRAMSRLIPDLIGNHDVGFFKMDGFCASCDTPLHAHHLDGDFAREANVDAFIEMLTAMRKAKPGVYLDPTSGMWLSPWWLWFVDSVYADTYDGTAPALVPSPNGFDGATTIRDALLRRRIAANPGFDPAAIETLGVYLDPTLAIDPASFFDSWHDNAMMVAGRGNRLLTFYMNPAKFPNPERDWPFLAGLIKWARHNATTLAQTEMILGDPYRGEAYGYAHFLGGRGILALRNPFIQPQTVHVKLDESCGWKPSDAGNGTYAATVVFPYHETLQPLLRQGDLLTLHLQPYQTILIEIEASGKSSLPFAGVRVREMDRSGRRISWEAFGSPGAKLSVPVSGLPKPSKIEWAGRPIKSTGSAGSMKLPLTFPGEAQRSFVESGRLQTALATNSTSQLEGTATVTIAKGTKAFLYVLCQDPSPSDLQFQCRATLNGIPVPASAIHTLVGSKATLREVRELPLKPWVFSRFPVPEGKNTIRITLSPATPKTKTFEVQAGWWLWTEEPLQRAILTMEFDESLPQVLAKVLPSPSGMEIQRQVIPLQELQSFTSRSSTRLSE